MLCRHASIRADDPAVPCLRRARADAQSLTALVLAAGQVSCVRTVRLGAGGLAERARLPPAWSRCPRCGGPLRSQGWARRPMTRLVGPIRWQRRVGRWPPGCASPQGTSLDAERGVQPPQRTSGELQLRGGALAVFVAFATAARLLGWDGLLCFHHLPVAGRAVSMVSSGSRGIVGLLGQ
jgi:hypothetical protein